MNTRRSAPLHPAAIDRRYLVSLLLLTVSTGVIDAVSYLALDRVFTGNMTGNVLFIGFGLVGVADIPLLNNTVALVAFVLGAVLCSRVVRGHSHESRLPTANLVMLIIVAVLSTGLALAWWAVGDLPEPALLVVTALLAIVMGAQAIAVRSAGVADVTTIVVTSTLANLAADSHLAGGTGERAWRRLAAVVAMGLGAVIGALLIRFAVGPVALLAAAVIMLVAVLLLALARRAERNAKRRSATGAASVGASA
ncbi:YoaK family protein [Microbacteriaceae bacterium 4G12]